MNRYPLVLLAALALFPATATAQQSGVDVWNTLLRPHHFPDVDIVEDNTVIEMTAPYRSEDAAVTPIRIKALIPQTNERYIRRIHLFVDANPEPRVGTFTFTPASGRAAPYSSRTAMRPGISTSASVISLRPQSASVISAIL